MPRKSAPGILDDPDFKELYTRKMTVAWTLTVLELVLFYGFVALVSYNKPFLARKLSAASPITIGIPIAVAVILISWVLTGLYVRWANTTHDDLANKIKDKIGG